MNKLSSDWHLDKRVNISVIFALVLQGGAFIWFISGLSERVNLNSSNIVKMELVQEELRERSSFQDTQLGRIETEIIGLRRDIGRLLDVFEKQ